MPDAASVTAQCTCPIYSFDIDGERVSLGDDLAIVRVKDDELWGMPPRLWAPPFGPPPCAFELVVPATDPAVLGSTRVAAQAVISEAITALRLLKGGFFDCGHVMVRRQASDGSAGVGIMSGHYAAPIRRGQTYHLHSAETGVLNDLLVLYRTSAHRDELHLAIRRLNFTYDRTRPTDRLIDATIALESLLLTGIRDELKYRLALRGAWLLGQDGPGRVDVNGLLRAAYDTRSLLVHASHDEPRTVKVQKHTGSDIQTFATFVTNVEDCLRDTIRKLLMVPASPTLRDVVEGLDQAALLGEHALVG